MSIKKVDPTLIGDYYDRLISGELATPAPEDSFKAPEEDAEQDVAQSAEPDQSNDPDQPPLTPADQPTEAPSIAPTDP